MIVPVLVVGSKGTFERALVVDPTEPGGFAIGELAEATPFADEASAEAGKQRVRAVSAARQSKKGP